MYEISLCMIVKNEEKNLKKCLSCIASFMDEIIIVDTGSVDRTKEVAYEYTDKVYNFEWINDFSAARNYSLSKATKDYILVLDSDEFAESIDMDKIKKLIMEKPLKIGRLLCVNEFTRGGHTFRQKERIRRLFPREVYHFVGAIHEQIVPITDGSDTDYSGTDDFRSGGAISERQESSFHNTSYPIPLTVLHSGYEGDLEARRRKSERNIALLKHVHEQNTDDPYILYQLGKSYYMIEDYISASDYFGQALYFDLDPRLEYVQDMVESYGYSLINSEKYEKAAQLLNIYDEFSQSADFIFLIGLILMNNAKFNEAIKEFLKAAEQKEAKMEGVNGYLAYYNIGVIFECLDDKKNAIKYYKKCGNYDAAIQRLKEIR